MSLVVFRRIAQRELDNAISWYEKRRIGLGGDLHSEVREFLDEIARSPEMFPVERGTIRRATLRRFPYTIHFLPEKDRIVVLAIFHAKRDPQILEDRS
jgi:plasmid stabilization system protein ParE